MIAGLSTHQFINAAVEWAEEQDQWVFCLELLQMSLWDDGHEACDQAIEELEMAFEKYLEQLEEDA